MTGAKRDPNADDVVVVLVDLRDAITPVLNDLICGVRPSVARWLAFADVVSTVILPIRHEAFLAALDEHGRSADGEW
jgi:hypothetical protein